MAIEPTKGDKKKPKKSPPRFGDDLRTPSSIPKAMLFTMAVGFCGFLLAINQFDLSQAFEFSDDPLHKRALINNMSRSSTALISTVFACLFLAIPLTANMYTPQLLELFLGARVNRVILILFVVSAAYSLSLSRVAPGVDVPLWHFKVAYVLVIATVIILLPYLFSVFRFLDPATIVQRVGAKAMIAIDPDAKGSCEDRRDHLTRRIRQLGNIALKSLDRADRDVALHAVSALDAIASRYLVKKQQHSEEWFAISSSQFPGLSREAEDMIRAEHVWVEMEVQRQLARALDNALKKVPDVISAISRAQRHAATEAGRRGDRAALELSLRYFNNFLREAVKSKDIHALYDLSYQAHMLGIDLWEIEPARVVKLGRHLRYYGHLAAAAGLPFARELVAHDLGRLMVSLPEEPAEARRGLLDVLLEIGSSDKELEHGIVTARAVAAARLAEAGHEAEAKRIEATIAGASREAFQTVETRVLGDVEPWFWEVTDRMQDLHYLSDVGRERVRAFLARRREHGRS